MGYHIKDNIIKGALGYFSKIEEEFTEAKDALAQNNHIMLLLELSDLIGAIEAFLDKNHNSISLDDLIKMKDATKSAFMDGTRK